MTYTRAKLSTIVKGKLPYCGCSETGTYQCQNYQEQKQGHCISRECKRNTDNHLDSFWYHGGAGCPEFIRS
jgi:hypothetical protein